MHFKQTQSFEELEDTRRHSWVWDFVWGHSATVFDFDILHQSVCDSVLHPHEPRLQFQRTAMARKKAESCLFLFHVWVLHSSPPALRTSTTSSQQLLGITSMTQRCVAFAPADYQEAAALQPQVGPTCDSKQPCLLSRTTVGFRPNNFH